MEAPVYGLLHLLLGTMGTFCAFYLHAAPADSLLPDLRGKRLAFRILLLLEIFYIYKYIYVLVPLPPPCEAHMLWILTFVV